MTYLKNMSISEMIIVFAGLTDDHLKEQIEAKGGKVASSMIKTATHMLMKKDSKPSKKIDDAKEKGLKFIDLDEFIETHKFTLGEKKQRGRPRKSAELSENNDEVVKSPKTKKDKTVSKATVLKKIVSLMGELQKLKAMMDDPEDGMVEDVVSE